MLNGPSVCSGVCSSYKSLRSLSLFKPWFLLLIRAFVLLLSWRVFVPCIRLISGFPGPLLFLDDPLYVFSSHSLSINLGSLVLHWLAKPSVSLPFVLFSNFKGHIKGLLHICLAIFCALFQALPTLFWILELFVGRLYSCAGQSGEYTPWQYWRGDRSCCSVPDENRVIISCIVPPWRNRLAWGVSLQPDLLRP